MRRIALALLACVLPALVEASLATTFGVSMALFDDNWLTSVRGSMKARAQQLNVGIQFVYVNRLPADKQLPPGVAFVGSDETQSGTLQMLEVCRLLQGRGDIVIMMGELTNQS